MLQKWKDVLKHRGKGKFSGDSSVLLVPARQGKLKHQPNVWKLNTSSSLKRLKKVEMEEAFTFILLFSLFKTKCNTQSVFRQQIHQHYFTQNPLQVSETLRRHTSLQIRMKLSESCRGNIRLMWYYHNKLYVPCIPFI